MGTTTGRMSQTNPDLQTIPGRPDLVKKQFKAREEFRNYFCKFDFTGQVPQEKEKND